MEDSFKLFMVMLGATPKGRTTEQHDIFFGIGQSLQSLAGAMLHFWPEAEGRLHIDAWREVTSVDGYRITIRPKSNDASRNQLFFLNLGGYRPGEFEEYHYKIVTVSENMAAAVRKAKSTAFYKHCGFSGASSHIDEKYGIDVDDIHKITDLLSEAEKQRFSLEITPDPEAAPDALQIGYLKFSSLLSNPG